MRFMTPFYPLERMTRRWWLFLVLLVLLALPSYASQPLTAADGPYLLVEISDYGLLHWISGLFPVFKFLPLALVVGLWFSPGRWTRWFHLYVAINLLLIAFLSNSGETPTYGFAILTGNVLICGLLAALWGWESAAGYSHLHLRGQALWRYWVLIPALLAFLYPVQTISMVIEPDFSPLHLLTNEAGLSLCMIMPLYLAVLSLAYPRVNLVVMRVSSAAGVLMASLHIFQYLFRPLWGVWLAVMHLPLLVIAVYALVLSYSRRDEPA